MTDLSALWLIAIAGGALALGIAIGYGVFTRRRLTPEEKRAQRRASRAIYESEDRRPD